MPTREGDSSSLSGMGRQNTTLVHASGAFIEMYVEQNCVIFPILGKVQVELLILVLHTSPQRLDSSIRGCRWPGTIDLAPSVYKAWPAEHAHYTSHVLQDRSLW
jgi:hypothetical protein